MANVTRKQSELAQEIKVVDTTWQTIKEEEMVDYSLGGDPYELPKEAKAKVTAKEFAFRWIEDTPERLQEVTRIEPPMRWWVCNSTNTPYLKKYLNPNTGALHCKDQILVFKPYWLAVKAKNVKSEVSENQLNSRKLDVRDGMVDNKGAEWKSGKNHKISSSDIVVAEDNG